MCDYFCDKKEKKDNLKIKKNEIINNRAQIRRLTESLKTAKESILKRQANLIPVPHPSAVTEYVAPSGSGNTKQYTNKSL